MLRPPPAGEMRALFLSYMDQGHCVSTFSVPGADESWGWGCKCSCGTTCPSIEGLIDGEEDLLSFEDHMWWARGHRTEHDLAWQDWLPLRQIA